MSTGKILLKRDSYYILNSAFDEEHQFLYDIFGDEIENKLKLSKKCLESHAQAATPALSRLSIPLSLKKVLKKCSCADYYVFNSKGVNLSLNPRPFEEQQVDIEAIKITKPENKDHKKILDQLIAKFPTNGTETERLQYANKFMKELSRQNYLDSLKLQQFNQEIKLETPEKPGKSWKNLLKLNGKNSACVSDIVIEKPLAVDLKHGYSPFPTLNMKSPTSPASTSSVMSGDSSFSKKTCLTSPSSIALMDDYLSGSELNDTNFNVRKSYAAKLKSKERSLDDHSTLGPASVSRSKPDELKSDSKANLKSLTSTSRAYFEKLKSPSKSNFELANASPSSSQKLNAAFKSTFDLENISRSNTEKLKSSYKSNFELAKSTLSSSEKLKSAFKSSFDLQNVSRSNTEKLISSYKSNFELVEASPLNSQRQKSALKHSFDLEKVSRSKLKSSYKSNFELVNVSRDNLNRASQDALKPVLKTRFDDRSSLSSKDSRKRNPNKTHGKNNRSSRQKRKSRHSLSSRPNSRLSNSRPNSRISRRRAALRHANTSKELPLLPSEVAQTVKAPTQRPSLLTTNSKLLSLQSLPTVKPSVSATGSTSLQSILKSSLKKSTSTPIKPLSSIDRRATFQTLPTAGSQLRLLSPKLSSPQLLSARSSNLPKKSKLINLHKLCLLDEQQQRINEPTSPVDLSACFEKLQLQTADTLPINDFSSLFGNYGTSGSDSPSMTSKSPFPLSNSASSRPQVPRRKSKLSMEIQV